MLHTVTTQPSSHTVHGHMLASLSQPGHGSPFSTWLSFLPIITPRHTEVTQHVSHRVHLCSIRALWNFREFFFLEGEGPAYGWLWSEGLQQRPGVWESPAIPPHTNAPSPLGCLCRGEELSAVCLICEISEMGWLNTPPPATHTLTTHNFIHTPCCADHRSALNISN